jgi:hypothetical protein
MTPINKCDLTPEERKGALRYLKFLKEKRCGTIKGRGCTDGRSQRGYMTKGGNVLTNRCHRGTYPNLRHRCH